MKNISNIFGKPIKERMIFGPTRGHKVASALLLILAITIWVMTIGVYAEDINRSSDTATIGLGVSSPDTQNITIVETIVQKEPVYETANESTDIKSQDLRETERMNSMLVFGSTLVLIITPFIAQTTNHKFSNKKRKFTC